eukprot:82539-Rhodomonas_salina.4
MGQWRRYVGGSFDWDACAYPSGVNSQGTQYSSSVRDQAEWDVRGTRVWTFPPPDLEQEFVTEAPSWGASVVVGLVPSSLMVGLISTCIYRGSTKKLLKGEEQSLLQSRCGGAGSVSCNENKALHIKCNTGVCWNSVLQGGGCVPLAILHLGGREWAATFSRDVLADEILGEYVG